MSDARAAVLLFEGFEELDAIGPYDVLRTAANYGAPVSVDLATADGAATVTASKGLRVEPDGRLTAADDVDYLIVPGGGWASRSEDGAWAEAERGVVPDLVAAHHDDGATVASVCTGAMLLERAGLLDGRPATTHESAKAYLRGTDAEVLGERVVDDGDVVTSGGVAAGVDMALWLVEREFGADVAERTATELEHERAEVRKQR
ncbi:DJ-1/PfpI family protein [Halomicrobium salinisoli]|uniref:DJ-1/PfpI family protein n=1 Tax=Halomicrobium salinisoli TaxID=2878391 RepID=UPI001CF00425|nr:DJ-1/PfpI family protein [Halomicrobium salinisoli]